VDGQIYLALSNSHIPHVPHISSIATSYLTSHRIMGKRKATSVLLSPASSLELPSHMSDDPQQQQHESAAMTLLSLRALLTSDQEVAEELHRPENERRTKLCLAREIASSITDDEDDVVSITTASTTSTLMSQESSSFPCKKMNDKMSFQKITSVLSMPTVFRKPANYLCSTTEDLPMLLPRCSFISKALPLPRALPSSTFGSPQIQPINLRLN
jgi:hypothetical protein